MAVEPALAEKTKIMKLKFNLKVDFNFGRKENELPTSVIATRRIADVFEDQIMLMAKIRSSKTILNYNTALRSFLAYAGADAAFNSLDSRSVEGYERWLRDNGVALNTISCYMRSLRAIYTEIMEQMKISGNEDPFKKAFRGNTRTQKRSVSTEDIIKIRELWLQRGTFEELTRNVFLFCFYAMGMPFVDAAHLKHSQISGNIICYGRRKTGQPVRVAIEPVMWDIINRYRVDGRERIFPLLPDNDGEETEQEYRIMLSRYNRKLKRIAKKAGIKSNITSYVVRHTWASAAYDSNIDLPIISKALGHTNTETTLIYIREIDDQKLHEANKMLLNSIGVIDNE